MAGVKDDPARSQTTATEGRIKCGCCKGKGYLVAGHYASGAQGEDRKVCPACWGRGAVKAEAVNV